MIIKTILQYAQEDITNCELGQTVTKTQLESLQKVFKKRFNREFGIDFRFPPFHMLQRSNKRGISICHIREMLIDAFKKYKSQIQDMSENERSGVFKSISTDINMPFEIAWNTKKTKKEFVPLTIMLKKNFFAKGDDQILKLK